MTRFIGRVAGWAVLKGSKIIDRYGRPVARRDLCSDWSQYICWNKADGRRIARLYDGELVRLEASLTAITPDYRRRAIKPIITETETAETQQEGTPPP